jgi:hypothetical protein
MSSPSRLESLAQRRLELVARADAQRAQLADYYRQIEAPVRLIQAGLGFANSLRRSPVLMAGTAAVLWRTPWRRMARVPRLLWRGWKVVQFVRGFAR